MKKQVDRFKSPECLLEANEIKVHAYPIKTVSNKLQSIFFVYAIQ
jgi:hypothetical protein